MTAELDSMIDELEQRIADVGEEQKSGVSEEAALVEALIDATADGDVKAAQGTESKLAALRARLAILPGLRDALAARKATAEAQRAAAIREVKRQRFEQLQADGRAAYEALVVSLAAAFQDIDRLREIAQEAAPLSKELGLPRGTTGTNSWPVDEIRVLDHWRVKLARELEG